MKKSIKPLLLVISLVLAFAYIGFNVAAQSDIESETFPIGENLTEANNTTAAIDGGPGFIMIHPTSFAGQSNIIPWQFGWGGSLHNPSGSYTNYYTGITLPQGAIITKLVVYYIDDSPGYLSIDFVRFDPLLNTPDSIANEITFDADPLVRVLEMTPISEPLVVDNQSYSYYINVGISGGSEASLSLLSIRIDYSYPVNLPMINK